MNKIGPIFSRGRVSYTNYIEDGKNIEAGIKGDRIIINYESGIKCYKLVDMVGKFLITSDIKKHMETSCVRCNDFIGYSNSICGKCDKFNQKYS